METNSRENLSVKKDLADKVNLYITYFVLFTLVLAIAVDIYFSSFFNLFITILTLILIAFPTLFQRRYRILLPGEMQLLIVLFIYAGAFLGGPRDFYERFWWWDTFLHLISGMALAVAGFLILYIFLKDNKLRAKPLLVAFFTFCFAICLGTLWEIFEFAMDELFATNMQRRETGVHDTMKDLIADGLGAFVVSVYGYLHLKKGDKSVFTRIIERFFEKNSHLSQPDPKLK